MLVFFKNLTKLRFSFYIFLLKILDKILEILSKIFLPYFFSGFFLRQFKFFSSLVLFLLKFFSKFFRSLDLILEYIFSKFFSSLDLILFLYNFLYNFLEKFLFIFFFIFKFRHIYMGDQILFTFMMQNGGVFLAGFAVFIILGALRSKSPDKNVSPPTLDKNVTPATPAKPVTPAIPETPAIPVNETEQAAKAASEAFKKVSEALSASPTASTLNDTSP